MFYKIEFSLLFIIIPLLYLFDMGKFNKSTQTRLEHTRARQNAIYSEMERLQNDKNVSDETLIHNYTKCFTTAVRQKKYNMAIMFADILFGYYRTYDMMSRTLSLQNYVIRIDRLRHQQNLGRVADKRRKKYSGITSLSNTVSTPTTQDN